LPISTIDGIKIDFDEGWVHLRPSNTEPIIRVYAESDSKEKADAFAEGIICMANDFMAAKNSS
jgi:phosphomannomutase